MEKNMKETKILIIVLSILLIFSISFILFCCERKASYPQETFPIVTDPIEETTTESVFVPSPEPSMTIPVETEATTIPTEPIIESTEPEITKPIPTEPIKENTPATQPSTTTPPTEPTIETTPSTTTPTLLEGKYPEATYVWNYLTQTLGYNDYVAAGILGNIMVEVGGYDLSLEYAYKYATVDGYTYYGICMWNIHNGYHPLVAGLDLEGQCEYLGKTITKEMNLYGSNYANGFGMNEFLALQDARQAAIAFGKCYERGACPQKRANCAEIAYDYFVNQTA